MTNFTKLTALTFVLVSAVSLGAGAANAATCDGTWTTYGHGRQMQCYYLPTISNGRVTGLELEHNFRVQPRTPGAVIGRPVPHNAY